MIEFRNISKKYEKADKNALTSMSFTIDSNELTCLLGPNGAGKTTIIKCISGLIIPDSGEMIIEGDKIDFKYHKYIQDVYTVLDGGRNLYWRATVRDNIYYFGILKGKSRKDINSNIEKYKKIFNFEHLLDKEVSKLSLGQKQIASIIIPIVLQPKILILDEPSNGLDIDIKNQLVELLKTIKNTINITIIIASHDVDFIRKIIDKIIIIKDGEVRMIVSEKNLTNKLIEEKYYEIISN